MSGTTEGSSSEYTDVLRLVREAKQLSADYNYDQARAKLMEAKTRIACFSVKATRTVRREIEGLLRGIADTGEWTREELLGEGIPPEGED